MQPINSVFDVLSDTPQQAVNLKLRAQLMDNIHAQLDTLNKPQRELAEICYISQPRVNDLLQGKISKFSLDALVNIHANIDQHITGCSRLHFTFA